MKSKTPATTTPPADAPKMLRQMESQIRSCRRRICLSVVAQAAGRGAQRSAMFLAVLAAAYLAIRAILTLAGVPMTVGLGSLSMVTGGIVLLCVAWLVVIAGRSLPSAFGAAERLDLAARSHNRIATAMNLLRNEETAGFAGAAILDGYDHLLRLKQQQPYLDAKRWRIRKTAILLACFTVMVILAGLIETQNRDDSSALDDKQIATHPDGSGLVNPDINDSSENTRRHPDQAEPIEAEPQKFGSDAAQVDLKSEQSQQDTKGGANGGTEKSPKQNQRATASMSDSKGDSKGMESKKDSPSEESKPNPKKSRTSRVKASPEKDDTAKGESSPSPGSSGGGSMLAVKNPGSENAKTQASDQDSADDDEENEEDKESNQQRGGIQPSLKDRREPPSNELGQGFGNEPGGNGRGGPSSPKKSRGTAAMIMGVPLPDFIKGRLLPGPTKITHERGKPSPMKSDPTKVVPTASRKGPESHQPKFHLASEFAQFVKAYLISLHSQDINIELQTTPK